MMDGTKNGQNEREYNAELTKPLPHAPEAERAILGSILLNNTLISQAMQVLMAEDFYLLPSRLTWQTMVTLTERGQPLDPLLIAQELRAAGQLESVGGVVGLTALTYGLPHAGTIAEYIAAVRDCAAKRDLLHAGNLIVTSVLEETESAVSLQEAAESLLYGLRRLDQRGPESAAAAVDAVLAQAEERGRTGTLPGLTTGYLDLDAMLGGWQPQDLIVLAARPSMGKSAMAINCAASLIQDVPGAVAGIFSLEMTREAIVSRVLCGEARIDSERFRRGNLSRKEWRQLADMRAAFDWSRLLIDDTPAISPAYLRAKLRRWTAEHKKVDLIVVDYLQLMASGKARDESETSRTSIISQQLKAIAKEFHAPVLALSQLSRQPELRANHRPQLADLRQSGQIEQDADIVAFIFREEVYGRTEDNANMAEVIIAKHRNGPVGIVPLAWLPEYTRFENLGVEDEGNIQ